MGSLRDGCFRLVLYDGGMVGRDTVGILREGCFASVLQPARFCLGCRFLRAVVRVVITNRLESINADLRVNFYGHWWRVTHSF